MARQSAAADVSQLSQSTYNLRKARQAEPVEEIELSQAASDVEVEILVARTQADIIANASQALRAQASANAQNVADLLDA